MLVGREPRPARAVLTSQNDNARTGANPRETTLTPANLNSRQFGKVLSLRVDGDVYAEPLYVPNVPIPGTGRRNVVYVAAEHDSVYAFDADGRTAEPLWHVSFLNSRSGIGTVPATDLSCPFIEPEIGITPTPVIDLNTGTLYVLARTKENRGLFKESAFVHRLHALAITTGAEKFRGPVTIGPGGFNPLKELPRAALLLAGGQVYMTWASSCDEGPYHGWLIAYDAHTLHQTAAFNTSPDESQSGIWQSDMGPAGDESGAVYVATGNGKFDAASGCSDYGDSLLKLEFQGGALTARDFFTPPDEKRLDANDLDLGSGGPVLLPGHFALIAGKGGCFVWLTTSTCEPLARPTACAAMPTPRPHTGTGTCSSSPAATIRRTSHGRMAVSRHCRSREGLRSSKTLARLRQSRQTGPRTESCG
jgi:hypothetical protein